MSSSLKVMIRESGSTTANMSDALSSHAADPINRVIKIPPVSTLEELGSELEAVFEIPETVTELNNRDFTRVSKVAIP